MLKWLNVLLILIFSLCLIDSNYDFLHITAKSPVDHEKREIFVFSQGTIVVWNIADSEMLNILHMMRNFEINKYEERIVLDEAETMPYTYSINRYSFND